MRDIVAAACGRSILLITHRPEGLDLVESIWIRTSSSFRSPCSTESLFGSGLVERLPERL